MIAKTQAKTIKKYKFILFVSGMSVKSVKALENINKICDTYLKGNFDLKIIDVYKHPHLACEYQIIGLPTLVKEDPMPLRTIIGDLSDLDKVLRILDIEK